jgi:hypothetical protein
LTRVGAMRHTSTIPISRWQGFLEHRVVAVQ